MRVDLRLEMSFNYILKLRATNELGESSDSEFNYFIEQTPKIIRWCRRRPHEWNNYRLKFFQ